MRGKEEVSAAIAHCLVLRDQAFEDRVQLLHGVVGNSEACLKGVRAGRQQNARPYVLEDSVHVVLLKDIVPILVDEVLGGHIDGRCGGHCVGGEYLGDEGVQLAFSG